MRVDKWEDLKSMRKRGERPTDKVAILLVDFQTPDGVMRLPVPDSVFAYRLLVDLDVVIVSSPETADKAIDVMNNCLKYGGMAGLEGLNVANSDWVTIVLDAEPGHRVKKGISAWE